MGIPPLSRAHRSRFRTIGAIRLFGRVVFLAASIIYISSSSQAQFLEEWFLREAVDMHLADFTSYQGLQQFSTPLPWNSQNYNNIIQDILVDGDSGGIRRGLIWSINISQLLTIPVRRFIQANSWDFNNGYRGFGHDTHDQREPLTGEIRLQANLGVAYGALGLLYYEGMSINDDPAPLTPGQGSKGLWEWNPAHTQIVPRWGNDYNEQKFQPIADMNARLLAIGDTLAALRWVNAIGFHRGTNTVRLRRVITGDQAVGEGYVEVGYFTRDPLGLELPDHTADDCPGIAESHPVLSCF